MSHHQTVFEKIQRMRREVDSLQHKARERTGDAWAAHVLEELCTSLEELQVTEEELRAQNEELRVAQEALVAERERYRDLFNSAPDAYLVTDDEGVIREANEAAGRLLGLAAARLIGKPVAVFVPVERRQAFRLELLRRRPAGGGEAEWELDLKRRGGSTVPVACTVVGVGDQSGTLRWLMRDVSERRRAEERMLAARQAEAAQRTTAAILERITDGFLAFDTDWHFTYVNRAAESILGVGRTDLLGRQLWRILPQLKGAGLGDALERAAREQAPTSFEDFLPFLDQWISVHAFPSADGLSVYFEDVSDRRAAEQERDRIAGELIAERAMLDQVLQQLPVGVLLAQAPSGKLLVANRVVQEMWKGSFPLVGSIEQYGSVFRGFHPDGRAYLPEEWPIARAVRHGEVVREEEVDLLIGERGRCTLSINAAPVRDSRGNIIAGVVSLQDVTARKQAEAEARFLEQVSLSITESLDYRETVKRIARTCAGVFADYCFIHVEDAGEVRAVAMAHKDPRLEEIVRALARRLPIEPDSDHPIARAIRAGETRLLAEVDDSLLRSMAADAEHLELMRDLGWASAVVVPLSARGRTLGALSLARSPDAPAYTEADLPLVEEVARRAAVAVDNARLYSEARTAVDARQKLLGVVSHDLRNALNAAVMHTELLQVTATGPVDEAQRKQFVALRRALDNMQRLVEDLLEVDSLETGRLKLQMGVVPVGPLLDEVLEAFSMRARERSLEVSCEVEPDLPPLRADHVRLVQVLSNLLANALQHTPPAGGAVRLKAARDGGRVRFSIHDCGPGIAVPDLPHVFERFWRGSGSSYTGTGLGLTISQGLVRAHGGEIGVHSAPGEGAVFWFTIPLVSEGEERA